MHLKIEKALIKLAIYILRDRHFKRVDAGMPRPYSREFFTLGSFINTLLEVPFPNELEWQLVRNKKCK
jgi:hypothetical protein